VLFSAAFFAVLLANVLFLTGVWGYSELRAGLGITPSPLLAAALSGPAGAYADRHGHRAIVALGSALVAAATIWFAVRVGPSPAYLTAWLPGALLLGAGVGLAVSTVGAAAGGDPAAGEVRSGQRGGRHRPGSSAGSPGSRAHRGPRDGRLGRGRPDRAPAGVGHGRRLGTAGRGRGLGTSEGLALARQASTPDHGRSLPPDGADHVPAAVDTGHRANGRSSARA
jgi:hypothetical protein